MEAQTVLAESLKILGGTIRRNGDGAGELQTENLHKALSIHHPEAIRQCDGTQGGSQCNKVVYIPHGVKMNRKFLHKNLL